jgi:hypothetical protein
MLVVWTFVLELTLAIEWVKTRLSHHQIIWEAGTEQYVCRASYGLPVLRSLLLFWNTEMTNLDLVAFLVENGWLFQLVGLQIARADFPTVFTEKCHEAVQNL